MVELIIVSHSAKIGEGIQDLMKEMAPAVPIHLASGLEDGSIGTDVTRILEAIETVGKEALILSDIGSATMNAELAIDMYEGDKKIKFYDGPIVESAFVAAVSSGNGMGLDQIMEQLKMT
ncbi:PTS-dependent dihydroxyacetone kinase phosphotransferase subunit DhaM [Exiguobacterium sp. SH1S4]|nr:MULTISPECIES: dihydroxyacetone kinase phosphoryl donor subunit DhaM [unclassified Exiguobacterium]TCI74528.1 PTS-dependent dihydroxyacetone kinase phosphotransferase subunit DhaM [Exiguobacterium sp. SH1S1]TCI80817.1 PTS-dependent dihydroxyacetone kinase phosphotransferase subunit DhaM [Exiguobacterium sp. SH0S1]OGX80095.1 PTS-dependent dihydroxyacetone kinase phosphotransferase subunit DhaM [Exiguobacterium sp. SH31]TCI39456.1 PTS-dependent dihydroxyacetone kinase phosphotransferase subunit